MKTAMQELIEAIELITKKYKRGLSTEEILDMCNNQLDKEKEQIMNAYSIGFLVSKDLDMPEASSYVTNDYYNQAHNQNK